MSHPLRPLAAALVLFAVACEGKEPGTRAPGPQGGQAAAVVDNTVPRWDESEGWSIDPTPVLRIGSESGDTAYTFADVQGALRLSGGQVVVADAGSSVLRYFAPDGTIVRSAGRQGQGPGEFEGLAWIGACGADSVFAWDFVLNRITVFDGGGTYVRSFAPGSGPTAPIGVRCREDGTILVVSRVVAPPPAEGPHRVNSALRLVDNRGGLLRDLGEVPGMDRYRFERSDGPRPLGRETAFGVGDGVVYVGTADSYEISALTLDGKVARQIRRKVGRRRVEASDIARYTEERLAPIQDPARRRQVARTLRDMRFPEHFPAYGKLVVDSEGHLWVEGYRRPGEDAPVWDVFAPDGIFLGSVAMPAGLEVYQIGADFVLGKWTDPDGVGYVRLHRLERHTGMGRPGERAGSAM